MIIHKAYKFRLYPNKEQQELIHKTFECNRFSYNHYLQAKQTEYQNTKKYETAYECIKDISSLLLMIL